MVQVLTCLQENSIISDHLAMDLSVQGQRVSLPKAISNLPPFPAVAIRALQMVSTGEERLRELHDLICTDPAFSAEILKFANSPLYGIRIEIKNTLQATILLGYQRVKGLVLTMGMRAYLGQTLEVPVLRACWRHSLACAILAEEFAKVSTVDKDVAYTAGIIHDVGRLALAVTHPKQYHDLLEKGQGQPLDLVQRERELFGIDHCQAGHSLITAWNLPAEFIEITSRHHDRPTDSAFDLLSVISLSCEMADTLGFGLVHSPGTLRWEDILKRVPVRENLELPPAAEELTARIASKISCIESI